MSSTGKDAQQQPEGDTYRAPLAGKRAGGVREGLSPLQQAMMRRKLQARRARAATAGQQPEAAAEGAASDAHARAPYLNPEERAARGPSVNGSSAAELTAAFPVKRVPAFPEKLLHTKDQPLLSPEAIERIEAHPWKEGPNLVKAPIEAGGMVVRTEMFFLWVEGGSIVGWMPARELPHGGMRRGAWLLWWGGYVPMEAVHDRPADAEGVHKEAPNLEGRDLERRVEAGAELNHDLEHFVATGSSLSEAMKQTQSVHQQILEIMVMSVATTMAGEALGAGMGQVEGIEQLASLAGNKIGKVLGKLTASAPKASEAMKDFAKFAEEVPEIASVKQTEGVINGMRRLFDLFEDLHVPRAVRKEYLGELRQRLAKPDAQPEELFKEMKSTVEASPAKYLRKGLEVPEQEYLGEQGFGSLRRAASLKSCMLMVNKAFLTRARALDQSLPMETSDLRYLKHSQKMIDLIASGKVQFDPQTDLRPEAVLEGMPGVSSAWFFAAADADVSSPASLQSQLAVGAEYKQGYVVFEVPTEMAGPQGLGARRPTALDLTVSPEGRPNPNTSEAFGRTEPTKPGQAPIREVVLPPVPLSKTTIHTYVTGH